MSDGTNTPPPPPPPSSPSPLPLPSLLLYAQGDGALLYKRQKSKMAMSQAELVFQILREGVQSAHSQVNALMWAGGDSLSDMLEHCSGEHKPLHKMMEQQQVSLNVHAP